ncbi:amidase [uncultured Jatrophihabitans sp.]|uniref:amidase n=1 Tax=uncultured Jatrophihabitans sp. TaxID=1610747 RepID=UPI0035CA9A01
MEPERQAAVLPVGIIGGPTGLSVSELARAVADGELSAVEITSAHLQRIAEVDGTLNALVRVDSGAALRAARAVDRRRARGAPLGPLAGVPLVVKDNVDVRRQPTTSGSHAVDDVVALNDAPALGRLRAAGAILLGRANMDEFAMGASTRTSVFGATRNPCDPARSPGGSSGGSAAAVAAGLAAFSLGTDTGGSIREPAAQCGIVGVAPSPGLVPIAGVVPFAPSFDRVGPLTRTVADAALVTSVLAGVAVTPPDARSGRPRVGVVRELAGWTNHAGVRVQLTEAVDRLGRAGVDVVEVGMPDAARALEAYLVLTSVECLPHLEHVAGSGQAGDEVVRRVALGRTLLGSDALAEAEQVRRRLITQATAAMSGCTALLSPTMPTTAPTWDSIEGDAEFTDPLRAPYTDCWTVIANLVGWPAMSVPAGVSPDDGMPVGVMLSGRSGSEAELFGLAAALESPSVPTVGPQSEICTLLG